ncbi:MAG TPA: hypothetical protein VKB26_14840 [Candidatus Acidoferrales bacterium]|nr:hypothetical protein [Candidatus Acidoferrales bacterium]
MNRRAQFALATTASVALCLALSYSTAAGNRAPLTQSAAPDQTPLTDEQVHDLMVRTIANQHRDDAALDSFERIEHRVSRANDSGGTVRDERTLRVVPTGSGTLRILLRQNGSPVPAALYQRQLRDWENILQVAVHPDDPREISVLAKQQKKRKERARFVDRVLTAYRITWVSREIRDGRVLEKLQLDPNPNYQPHDDPSDLLTHARATVWIDPEAAQVASVDATVIRAVNFGGGVLGKIYRGGTFHMEQAPVAPDIWEPSLYQYDISGRKFLFSFTMHEATSTTHYNFLGEPEKALEVARDDLAHCCRLSADP